MNFCNVGLVLRVDLVWNDLNVYEQLRLSGMKKGAMHTISSWKGLEATFSSNSLIHL
jgi:hypothetical protein